MEKIKLIFLIILINSGFFTKIVVADTTITIDLDTVTNYQKLTFCDIDTVFFYNSTIPNPDNIVYIDGTTGYPGNAIILTKNSVTYSNDNGITWITENRTIIGRWMWVYNGMEKNFYIYFTTPLTEEPWAESERAICGTSDTLYAGSDSYQEGVYFKWENITAGTTLAEGYYPNDTSLIVNETADYVLTETGGCNTITDTIHLTVTTDVLPNLGADYSVCGEEFNEILYTTEHYDTYNWMDGTSADPTFHITEPGTYWVYAENACVSAYDTITIVHKVYPWLSVGNDHGICDNSTETLDMGFDYDVMSWNEITETDTVWLNYNRTLNINRSGHFLAYVHMTGCDPMTDDISISVVYPYENNNIGVVTVDTSMHNKIVWEKMTGVGISHYNIYHLNTDYELIGSVNIADEPVFYDTQSDPRASAHRYKISAVDTCGNESDLSMYHSTIHITSTTSTDGGLDLTVTDPYIDESGNFQPDLYYVLIDSLNNGQYSVIDSMNVVFNSYHVSDAVSGAAYMMGVGSPVEVIDSSKTKSPSINQLSVSNKTSPYVSVNELNKSQFTLYPNPAKKSFVLNFIGSQNLNDATLDVSDITGKVVYEKSNIKQLETIDVSGLEKGIYFVKIKQKNTLLGIKKLIID